MICLNSVILIIFIFCISFCENLKLSKYQWESMKKLIENKNLSLDMRNKINTVIFNYYDDWTYYKAKEFKAFHKNKCRHIPLEELHLYSRIGLMKAIRNYKGKSVFSIYAKIYIDGELYKGMTKLHPITSIPLNERKHNSLSLPLVNKKKSYTQLIGNNGWILDDISYNKLKYNNHESTCLSKQILEDDYREIWNKVDKLDPQKRKMFYYKFNYEFEKIRTNKQVGELMGCTNENVRKIIQNNIHKVLDK